MEKNGKEKNEVEKANKGNGGLIWQNWYAGFYDAIHGVLRAHV